MQGYISIISHGNINNGRLDIYIMSLFFFF